MTNYVLDRIKAKAFDEFYANYEIFHPKVKTLTHKEFLGLQSKTSALVAITEMYGILDSRTSASKKNRAFSYIVFQSRKNNLEIVYDAQMLSSVDLRLRRLTPLKVLCQAVPRPQLVPTDSPPDWFQYSYTYQTLRGLKVWSRIMRLEQAQKVFPQYSTKQIINFMDEQEA